MANTMYNRYKQALHSGEITASSDSPKATLSDAADYTPNFSTHTSYATDVAAGAKVAESGALGSITLTDGVFDTADFTWATVTGDQCEQVIIWFDGPTTPVADPLAVLYDTGMTGMPVTPSGGNINFTVNASGWYAI